MQKNATFDFGQSARIRVTLLYYTCVKESLTPTILLPFERSATLRDVERSHEARGVKVRVQVKKADDYLDE